MPAYDSNLHHRRTMRLPGYDYAQEGAYFITICTHQRACLFGEVTDGEMALNEIGKIAQDEWLRSATVRAEVVLDAFCVMPNHLHGVVMIRRDVSAAVVGATGRSPLQSERNRVPHACGPGRRSLGALIAGFKAAATRRINEARSTPGQAIWQRGYYDRIIRDDDELAGITEYVLGNPRSWTADRENPRS